MKGRIARSVFWLVWSRGAAQVVSFLSTLIVARLLSPADYGLMALASGWTYIVLLLADLGLGPAIIQFRDLGEGELNACFWLTMTLAVGSYLALYVSAPAMAAWFANPILGRVLRVTGLSLPLVATRIVPDSLLRKRLDLDKVSQAELAATLVTVPVVLGMAWSGAGVWALVAGSLITPLIQNVAVFWFVRWRPGFRVGSTRLGEILRYSLATLGARVGWAAYSQADAFVLGKVSGSAVLGFYSMATMLANLPVDKVSVVLNQLALPVMAGLQTDRSAMRASFLRALRLLMCLIVPLCLGMALVAGDLINVALGVKWTPIIPLLRLLCVYGLFRSFAVLVPPILYAHYRATFMLWWTGALLLIMLPAFWAGATWRGALGVVLAWVLIYPVVAVWMIREGLRGLDIGWKTIWDQVRPITGPALMMTASVLIIMWTIPGSDLRVRLVRLALSSGLGALVYVGGILWRRSLLAGEILEVVGWLFRPRHAAPHSDTAKA